MNQDSAGIETEDKEKGESLEPDDGHIPGWAQWRMGGDDHRRQEGFWTSRWSTSAKESVVKGWSPAWPSGGSCLRCGSENGSDHILGLEVSRQAP